MQQRQRPFPIAVVIALVIVALDQLVKVAVAGWIGHGQTTHTRWLLGDWLGFAYAENRGVAFGLLRGQSILELLLVAAAILVALGCFIYTWRRNPLVGIGGGLIIGGAIGNIIDRARFGYVRDFFAVGPWPSFNIADSAITCGVIIIALGVRYGENRGASTANSQEGMRTHAMETAE
jgi:signal peptidase II